MDEEKVNELFIDFENLKYQVGILVGRIESEKGTLGRETKRITEEISKVENTFKDIFYGRDRVSGLIVELDRLKQESLQRHKTKQNIILLWVTVGSLVVKAIIELLVNKI